MGFPLFDLSGRRALVTGSSQGIGYALAEGLAAGGLGGVPAADGLTGCGDGSGAAHAVSSRIRHSHLIATGSPR